MADEIQQGAETAAASQTQSTAADTSAQTGAETFTKEEVNTLVKSAVGKKKEEIANLQTQLNLLNLKDTLRSANISLNDEQLQLLNGMNVAADKAVEKAKSLFNVQAGFRPVEVVSHLDKLPGQTPLDNSSKKRWI